VRWDSVHSHLSYLTCTVKAQGHCLGYVPPCHARIYFWPVLGGCPGSVNIVLIQVFHLHSSYYTFFVSTFTFWLLPRCSNYNQLNPSWQTIRKVESMYQKPTFRHARKVWSLEKKNYISSSTILISCLETIYRALCRVGLQKNSSQSPWDERTEISIMGCKGSWTHRAVV
jgi:hypothetical protein